MARLQNPNLRELYLLHPNDNILSFHLIRLENIHTGIEYDERERQINGEPIIDPNEFLRINLNKLHNINREIYRILHHMFLSEYDDLDIAQRILSDIIDSNMRLLRIDAIPGLLDGSDTILQLFIRIRNPPLNDVQREMYRRNLNNLIGDFDMQALDDLIIREFNIEAEPIAAQAAPIVPVAPVAPRFDEPTQLPEIDDSDQEGYSALGRSYQERLTCPVCYINEVNTALLPCGHLLCSSCAQRIQNYNKRCPKCQQLFTHINKIFYQKYLKYKNKYLQLKNFVF